MRQCPREVRRVCNPYPVAGRHSRYIPPPPIGADGGFQGVHQGQAGEAGELLTMRSRILGTAGNRRIALLRLRPQLIVPTCLKRAAADAACGSTVCA